MKELSELIKHARLNFEPSRRNETWTRRNLIEELLRGLGWNTAIDLRYEDHPADTEGWLDYILDCQPRIGIEAKKLDVVPPRDYSHPQVRKALDQCKERKASYLIWTNGDCWQFFSLVLPNAPFYQVVLSETAEVQSNERKLHIIDKKLFTANPKHFDEAIRKNWQITAVPAAWKILLQEHPDDLFQLVQEHLPAELYVENGEIKKFNDKILGFVETFKADIGPGPKPKTLKFPDAWEQLLDPMEPEHDKVRERFRSNDNYRKLTTYLISENYKPWPKGSNIYNPRFRKREYRSEEGYEHADE